MATPPTGLPNWPEISQRLTPDNLLEPECSPVFFDVLASQNRSPEEVGNELGRKWDSVNQARITEPEELIERLTPIVQSERDNFQQADADAKRSHQQHTLRKKEPLIETSAYEKTISYVMPVILVVSVLVGWNGISQYAIDGVILESFPVHPAGAYIYSLFAVFAGLAVKFQVSLIVDVHKRKHLLDQGFRVIWWLLGVWVISFATLYAGHKSEDEVYLFDKDLANLFLLIAQIIGEPILSALIWVFCDAINIKNRPEGLIHSQFHNETLDRKSDSAANLSVGEQQLAQLRGALKQASGHRDDYINRGMTDYHWARQRRAARLALAELPPMPPPKSVSKPKRKNSPRSRLRVVRGTQKT